MRPKNLKTKIFLDSSDVNETKKVLETLGFLDGQTTNPSLIAKNPQAQERIAQGNKFSQKEVYDFYKKVVKEISSLIPKGSVSIEVYAERNTKAEQMLVQAEEMYAWINNAHIKLPIITEGLEAAHQAVKKGMRLNMTLCFSELQAAAVYTATEKAKPGDVFISPFVGRLDDRGQNGMDLIKNILKIYETGDGHVQVLAASVRNLSHFLCALSLGCDIITAPFKILMEWHESGMPVPRKYIYKPPGLEEIKYKFIALKYPWKEYNIYNEQTSQGIDKFTADWNSLIKM